MPWRHSAAEVIPAPGVIPPPASGNLVLPCRRRHRLVHEGGFGVERTADSGIRFTRPDGCVIDERPRLPRGDIDRFRDSISGMDNPPIDASDWTIPEGVMALDLAVGGLIEFND